HPQQATDD
nr:Chain B, Latent membrane protein 1